MMKEGNVLFEKNVAKDYVNNIIESIILRLYHLSYPTKIIYCELYIDKNFHLDLPLSSLPLTIDHIKVV